MTLRDDLMVQQQLKHPHRKWKHMIAVMCLNQTYRKQVKRVLPELWDRYPTPQKYLSGRLSKQQKILEPFDSVGEVPNSLAYIAAKRQKSLMKNNPEFLGRNNQPF